jgi:hydrogenase maturation protease
VSLEPQPDVRCVILGLGSPHGDDRAAWEVIARLPPLPRTAARAVADPLAVTELPTGCELLIVVDACRGGRPPGTVREFRWPDPALGNERAVSSHGVALAAALDLARVLGRLPPRVLIVAVEAAEDEPLTGLSPAVEAAIPDIVARVCAAITATGGEP